MRELARYWATEHDWREVEARLNALPLIVTHGWPGSVIEQMKIIALLTDPTAHGGRAEAAFHLVIPSLPGHGFSGKPAATGWDPIRIARAWILLGNPRHGWSGLINPLQDVEDGRVPDSAGGPAGRQRGPICNHGRLTRGLRKEPHANRLGKGDT